MSRDERPRDAMGVLMKSDTQVAYEANARIEGMIQRELKPACPVTGKTIFKSPSAAKAMVRTIRRRSDERMHEYRCEHCRQWHVGHGDEFKLGEKAQRQAHKENVYDRRRSGDRRKRPRS